MARVDVTTPTGKTFSVEKLNVRERLRLIRAMGPAADIDRYAAPVMVAASVRAIDGVPVPLPVSVDQCDALIDRLGDEGLAAVTEELSSQIDRAINETTVKN